MSLILTLAAPYIEVFNAVSYVNLPERGSPIASPHLGKRRENICSTHYKAYALFHGFILFIKKRFFGERICSSDRGLNLVHMPCNQYWCIW